MRYVACVDPGGEVENRYRCLKEAIKRGESELNTGKRFRSIRDTRDDEKVYSLGEARKSLSKRKPARE